MRKFPVEWKTRAKGLDLIIRLGAGLHSPVHCRRAVVGSSCLRCVLNWHLKLAQIATGVAWNHAESECEGFSSKKQNQKAFDNASAHSLQADKRALPSMLLL